MNMHEEEKCFNHYKIDITMLCEAQLSLCASEYFILWHQEPISLTQFYMREARVVPCFIFFYFHFLQHCIMVHRLIVEKKEIWIASECHAVLIVGVTGLSTFVKFPAPQTSTFCHGLHRVEVVVQWRVTRLSLYLFDCRNSFVGSCFIILVR